MITNNIVMWETLPNNADWDCFKTPILQEILRSQIFGSHTFVPISWMCKKQTSVSHSSTESEIISLDAGLRFDGIPALPWDLIVSVLGNTFQTSERPGRPVISDKNGTRISGRIVRSLLTVVLKCLYVARIG